MIDDEEITENSEEEELSFSELFATVTLSGEIIITILAEEIERVKTGIKNAKAKQAAKFKEDGLVPDPSTLSFKETPSKDHEGYVDMQIILARKSTVRVAKIIVPDNEL